MKKIIYHILIFTLSRFKICKTEMLLVENKQVCTDELFFLENSAYQPRKGESRIRNPAFFWKTKLEEYRQGDEIYDKLDETQYEYMLYAFQQNFHDD